MNVLTPGALTNFGPTATYFYNERGEDALDGMQWYIDNSLELIVAGDRDHPGRA